MRLAVTSTAIVAALAALGGCTDAPSRLGASPTSPAPSAITDWDEFGPPRSNDPLRWSVRVTQDQENPPNTFLKVTSYGSGSCPYLVSSVTALNGNRLHIEFGGGQGMGELCTADLAPHTDRVPMPEQIDLFEPMTALLDRGENPVVIAVKVPGRGIQQGNTVS